MSEFTGYAIELERPQELEAGSMPFRSMLPHTYGIPDEIDPRTWHKIENQGRVGSCQGWSLASVCEMAFRIASGDVFQFSAMWGYLRSQQYDGLIGRDVGSTLASGLKTASDDGMCPEKVFPYPGVYTTRIPREAVDAAQPYKIQYHSVCRSYDDVFAFLSSGQGGVQAGMSWGLAPNREGVIEAFGRGRGGHAVAFLGYSRRKDADGRKYLWLANSWSLEWGINGWAEVSPQCVDAACRQRDTVMIGYSDLTVPQPRKVDFSKMRPLG